MIQPMLFLSETVEFRTVSSPDHPWILMDLRLIDHVCRAVAHRDNIWVYHGQPGPGMDYNANLTRIDEVPAGLGPQEIAEQIVTGQAVKVWSL